jgi:hypothetical protein
MPDLGNSSVFFQADASNNSGTMPSWSGSAAPSTLDDAGRALQGAVTREWSWRSITLTAAGTANAKTLTYTVAPAALYNGQQFGFIANTTNTNTCTLNINSLGAKTIKKDVSGTLTNLSSGDMPSGSRVVVSYNASDDSFCWINWQGTTTIADNAVTYAKIQDVSATSRVLGRKTSGAGDTEECTLSEVLDFIGSAAQGDILYRGASAWERLAAGTDGQLLRTRGTGANPSWVNGIVRGTAQATTSGTAIDFTSIPAWAQRVTVMLRGVSTNGTSELLVQIGDSGGIENTGYISTASNQSGGSTDSSTAGFIITDPQVAADVVSGTVTISKVNGNIWVANGLVKRSTSTISYSAGDKELSATLDRVRITTVNGTDAFDAGSINISYE